MNSWIDLKSLGEIVVVGLLAGAGLPALFAVGVRALATPARGTVSSGSDNLAGRNPAGIALAAACFLVVLAAIGYGIYIIVASGHK